MRRVRNLRRAATALAIGSLALATTSCDTREAEGRVRHPAE